MRYYYPVPNGIIYGSSLKIQNLSDSDVTGIYSDCGIFLTYDDGSEFPLITASQGNLLTIPAGSTVWIHSTQPEPYKPAQQCRIAIDSTSLPDTCLLTAVIKLGVVANGNPNQTVV